MANSWSSRPNSGPTNSISISGRRRRERRLVGLFGPGGQPAGELGRSRRGAVDRQPVRDNRLVEPRVGRQRAQEQDEHAVRAWAWRRSLPVRPDSGLTNSSASSTTTSRRSPPNIAIVANSSITSRSAMVRPSNTVSENSASSCPSTSRRSRATTTPLQERLVSERRAYPHHGVRLHLGKIIEGVNGCGHEDSITTDQRIGDQCSLQRFVAARPVDRLRFREEGHRRKSNGRRTGLATSAAM